MTRRLTGTPPAVLATLVAFVVVSGCSGNSNTPATTTPSSTSAGSSTAPRAHGAYEQCLTDHGVPAPSENRPGPAPGPPPEGTPGSSPPPPPGVDEATWDNALNTCRSLAPSRPDGSH
jgi:hypothetical protein